MTGSSLSARITAALADRYEIQRELGQGGMATVYLAQDLKHDRKVAIKVLRPELAAVLGAERFVHEIKTTAHLQHPNILALYDSGEAQGFLYYVMPYIAGETLRNKLDREKQLGIDEAVRITTEIAEALNYAHRQEVIHRDIKPENILLHDGRPMVADFGIALAVSAAAGGRMTETGLSLGTPHYMSPEQATAEKDLTSRSDVYSLGAMLYEMLTGSPPHVGSSAQQIIMKIVTEEPAPVTTTRKSVPPHVAAAVSKALEKLPADRFETAAAFAAALANPSFGVERRAAMARGIREPLVRRRQWVQLTAAIALVALGALLGWLVRGGDGVERPVIQFQTAIPGAPLQEITGTRVAVSPDGNRVVYVGLGEGSMTLYDRPIARLAPTAIPGTDKGSQPFFSPDGRSIGFFHDDGRLVRMPLAGGAGFTIARRLGDLRGATWTDRDQIVFAPAGLSGLHIVSASGGTPEPLTALDTAAGERAHRWPHALPGGRFVLFTSWRGVRQTAAIHVVDIETRETRPVLAEGMNPRYDWAGFLLFARGDGSLAAVPFDARNVAATGPASGVVDRIILKGGGAAEYDISRTSVLAYIEPTRHAELLLIDGVTGAERPLSKASRGFRHPRFSPTGDRIALTVDDGGFENVWVLDVSTDRLTRVTFTAENDQAEWHPDGSRLAFSSTRGGDYDLWLVVPGATSTPDPLVRRPLDQRAFHWHPAGRAVIYEQLDPETREDLWRVDSDGTAEPRSVVATPAVERTPRISGDGRWLAYVSDEGGVPQVYVRRLDGSGERSLISRDRGDNPIWSRDGRALYYARGSAIVRAALGGGASLGLVAETVVYDRYQPDVTGNYDVHPDGRHLVVVRYGQDRMLVTLNWIAASGIAAAR